MTTEVITFHYTLTDPTGKTLDSSIGNEPLTFISGNGQIIPGLETELTKLNAGDKKRISVPAKDAYGELDPNRIFDVPVEKFPEKNVKVGDKFRMGDGHHAAVVTVVGVTGAQIRIDANHPLAGVDLTFAVELIAKRAATKDELEGCCEGKHEGECCGRHEHCEH